MNAPPTVPLQTPSHARWRSLRLSHIVTLTMGGVLAIVLAASSWWSLAHLEAHQQRASEQQLTALARGIAALVRGELVLGDQPSLEYALSEFSKVPDIEMIELISLDGRSGFRINVDDARGPRVDHTLRQAEAPSTPGVNVRRSEVHQHLEVWYPIGEASPRGWVRVEQSVAAEREASAALVRSTMLGGIGILLLSLSILYLLLRRAIQPLEQASRFAKDLDTHHGRTLDVRAISLEVRTLIQALNQASRKLHEQVAILSRRDAELRAVIETAPNAVIGLDEAGRVRLFNPSATSMFGPTAEQAIDSPIDRFLPSIDRQTLNRLLAEGARVGSGGLMIARAEVVGLRSGETEFPIEIAISEVIDSPVLRYTLILRDITEQRMANDHLNIYVRALECSSNGMVIADARLPHLPVLWANSATERITGYSADEMVGRSCSFLQGPDRDQPALQGIRDAVRLSQPGTAVLRNYRRDGTPFWNQLSIAPVLDEGGKVTHFVGAITDITDRVLAEEAVVRRSAQLDMILRLSPDGFALFDADDRFVYANEAFARMTSISAATLSQTSQGRAHLEQSLRQLADPTLPWPGLWDEALGARQCVLIEPERKILSIETKQSASGDQMLFLRDVTRETEVDRMKSEFLSTAAHELRTPLVSIFGYSELLLTRQFAPERVKMMVETIHRQAGLIVNLINELLDLARIEARQGKDFRMSVQTLQPQVSEAITAALAPDDKRVVRCQLPAEPCWASIDAEKFRQALTNVISNAQKYSPGGGAIEISMVIESRREMEMAGIRVQDHGIGMTPSQLLRVFERFYRADPSGNIPGTGLGLSIVKEIIELHGGEVEIHSAIDEGTTVTLWLPTRPPREDPCTDCERHLNGKLCSESSHKTPATVSTHP